MGALELVDRPEEPGPVFLKANQKGARFGFESSMASAKEF